MDCMKFVKSQLVNQLFVIKSIHKNCIMSIHKNYQYTCSPSIINNNVVHIVQHDPSITLQSQFVLFFCS